MPVLVLFPLIHKLGKSSGQKYKRDQKQDRLKSQVKSMRSVCLGIVTTWPDRSANTSWGKWAFESDLRDKKKRRDDTM